MTGLTIVDTIERPSRCDRCTCTRAYCALDSRDHDSTCIGRHPAGWRARMPEFLFPEIDRILAGEPRDAPIYRDMAVEHAVIARYGLAIGVEDLAQLTPTTKDGTDD